MPQNIAEFGNLWHGILNFLQHKSWSIIYLHLQLLCPLCGRNGAQTQNCLSLAVDVLKLRNDMLEVQYEQTVQYRHVSYGLHSWIVHALLLSDHRPFLRNFEYVTEMITTYAQE